MKLYNQNTDKIENIKYIDNNGIKYINNLTDVELNSYGYYKLEYSSVPNTRYYNAEKTSELIEGVYKISYIQTDKPIEEIKIKMRKDLKEAFIGYAERPSVDTGLGFSVDGGIIDVKNFEIGRKYVLPQVKAADGIFYDVTDENYIAIISAIELNGITLYQTKWGKELYINSIDNIGDCILYEATPYEAQQRIEDDFTGEPILDGEGNEQFETVTRYKNNIKEW